MTHAPWLVLAGAALLVVAVHAGLIPAGRWQGDEYFGLWFLHRFPGLSFYLRTRLLGASPRPVAELLDYLYLHVALRWRAPLLAPALAVTWLAAAALVLAVAARAQARRQAILLLAVTALLMLLRRPGEMFFWPVGAFPYLLGFAGLGAVSILHRLGASGRRRTVLLGSCLVFTAFCNEVCAATVGLYAVLVLLSASLRRHAPDPGRLAVLALAGLSSAAVCGIVFFGRIHPQDLAAHPAAGLDGALASAVPAAVPLFLRLLASLPVGYSDGVRHGLAALALGPPALAILLLAAVRGAAEAAPERADLVCWCVALLGGCFGSVLIALEQFGGYCCARHTSLQTGMVLLAMFTAGGLFVLPRQGLRLVLLALLLGAGLASRMPQIRHDYRWMPRVIADRHENWRALTSADETARMLLPPAGEVVNGDALHQGRFAATKDLGTPGAPPWEIWGILDLFRKRTLTVVGDDRPP